MSRDRELTLSFALVTVATFILTSTQIVLAHKLDGNIHTIKTRRDSSSGLIAFPRVGRGHDQMTWSDAGDLTDTVKCLPLKELKKRVEALLAQKAYYRYSQFLDDHSDLHEMKKSLMAFPRVGRRAWKRADRDGSNNMWFGPRLGRSSGVKRESEIMPWSFFSVRGLPNLSLRRVSDTAFTPRLGRESNEDTSNYEDSADELDAVQFSATS